MPRSANGPCGVCRHHVSMHRYDPEKPRSGPQQCDLGCTCPEYVRPLANLRRQYQSVERDGKIDPDLRKQLLAQIKRHIDMAEKAKKERQDRAREERKKARAQDQTR